jgi:hypothetical protein
MPSAVKWTPRQLALFEAGKIPRTAKRKPAIEFRTHVAIADMLRKIARPGWWWGHIPSGELRSKATAGRLERMGTRPGAPDFLFLGPGGVRFLELKRQGSGRLSDAQLDFAGLCHDYGVPHAVVHNFREAEAQLREWDVLRPEAR